MNLAVCFDARLFGGSIIFNCRSRDHQTINEIVRRLFSVLAVRFYDIIFQNFKEIILENFRPVFYRPIIRFFFFFFIKKLKIKMMRREKIL